jgi:hypothetical protein
MTKKQMKRHRDNIKRRRVFKSTILLFLFILFSTLTLAQPPFQSSEGLENELTVIFPKAEALKKGTTPDLHFHVMNSTGFQLNNTFVDCKAHIYEPVTNNHILRSDLVKSSNWYDLEINLNENTTRMRGTYSLIVWCNSTQGEAGFISEGYVVTNSGGYDEQSANKWLGLLLVMLFVSFIMIYTATKINQTKMNEIKVVTLLYGVFNAFLTPLFALGLILNPFDIKSMTGLLIAYFSINILIMILWVWLYGKFLIIEVFKGGKQ